MFSMQLLNTFYLLKDLKNRFFNENKKFWNKVMNLYILFLLHQLLALFVDFWSYFLRIYFVPEYPYCFRYLVIVFFNFTVYDIIYIYKKKKVDYLRVRLAPTGSFFSSKDFTVGK